MRDNLAGTVVHDLPSAIGSVDGDAAAARNLLLLQGALKFPCGVVVDAAEVEEG